MIAGGVKEKVFFGVDRIAYGAFFTLAIMLPFSKAVIEVVAVVLFLCFVVKMCMGKSPLKKIVSKPCNALVIIFFLGLGLSLFSAGDLLPKSFHAWVFKWGEGVVFFLAAQEFLTRKRMKMLLWLMLIASVLLCCDGLYQKYTGVDFIRGSTLVKTRDGVNAPVAMAIRTTFPHYNGYAAYLMVLISVAFMAQFSIEKVFRRFLMIGMLVLMGGNLFFTYSRGAWFALVVAGVFCSFLFMPRKAKGISILVFSCCAIVAISMPLVRERLILSGDSGRVGMWMSSLTLIEEKPFIGIGLGLFMDHIGKVFQAHAQYAHNCYVQLLVESGIVGLSTFLLFLGTLIVKSCKALLSQRDVMLSGVWVAFAAYVIHAFFDAHLYSLQLATLFWIMAGFLAVIINEQHIKSILRDAI